MGDDAVEALECLKSWQRDDLIAASQQDIKAVQDILHALCLVDLEWLGWLGSCRLLK